MKLDYNRLSELLNSFGLSLKIENGNAIFVDVETNSPMKSYIVYKEGFADQEVKYVTDANILLSSYPFYLENENKYFRLKIFAKNENIEVYEITKTERKEPHLYESSELKTDRRTYTLEETTYKKHTRENGLENIVQLLTMKANKIKLTEEIYHQFKTGESTYKKLNLEKFITNFRNQSNEVIDNNLKYNVEYTIDNSNFNTKDNYRLDYFLSKRI